jgi:hypothetical protein
MKNNMPIVLALYPNARGLGYVCLENPKKIRDSGMVQVFPISNDRILKRVVKFADFFKPTLILVQDCDSSYSRHSKRVARLVEDITKHAKEIKVPVYQYSRQQIRDTFEVFGAKSKHEIVQQIIKWFPQLEPLAPKIRKSWMAEDYSMGIFDALSLAVTHQYLTE